MLFQQRRLTMSIRTNVITKALVFVAMAGFSASANADPITDWNSYAASAVVSGGRGPGGYVDLAYMHIAVYDAVNAIDGRYTPFAVTPSSVPAGSVKGRGRGCGCLYGVAGDLAGTGGYIRRSICEFAGVDT